MVPPCPCCGAVRVFEFQLVPSILHLLEVDKLSAPTTNSSSERQGLAAFEAGGMNWGNIAVFSCPQVCAAEQEYVLIQQSIDDRPSEPRENFQQGDVLIQEDSRFDDDEDDEDEEEEDEIETDDESC